MTKSDFIKKLTEKIDANEVDAFFKLIKTSINTSKYNIAALTEEWDRIQQTENLGLFKRTQALAAFKSFFERYAQTTFDEISVEEITFSEEKLTEKMELVKLSRPEESSESHTTLKTRVNAQPMEMDLKVGKRPILITVLCVFGFISIWMNLFNITVLASFKIKLNEGILVIVVVQMLLQTIHLIGLWIMKKWNIIFYGINFIFGLIVLLTNKILFGVVVETFNYFIVLSLIGVIFYSIVLGVYYKRMT